MPKRSILDYFLARAEQPDSTPAALVKRDGSYQPVSWRSLIEQANAVSKGLVALGVQPDERVALIMATRLEWVIVDMGIIGAGAVTVPIYPSSLPDECRYLVENSDSMVVIAENRQQTEKFLEVRDELPTLRKIVQLEEDRPSDPLVIGFEDFLTDGHSFTDDILEARRKGLNESSVLTIIYTSGTTGLPKGVVLTHGNMMYEAECVGDLDVVRPDDLQLLFLPLAHSFAKVIEIAWLAVGHPMAFAENMTTIAQNLKEVRPAVMCGVPRVFEKFYAAVVEKGAGAPGLRGAMVRQALRLSQKNGELELAGRSLPLWDALQFAVLRRLVLTKISANVREALGGRMRAMLSGGAPLPRVIAWFFRDLGIPIMEGYGLTETSAGTVSNRPAKYRLGTVGLPVPGTEVALADDGEILVRGPGVMREYWKDPEATAEVLKDGWFHTGDIGQIDDDGFLMITDRKKNLIVTAGGKNIAPQKIENLVQAHPLVSHCLVYGDRRKFLTALITLDPAATAKFAEEQADLRNRSHAELTRHPRITEEIRQHIDGCNRHLASYETLKKYVILEADFSQDTGELTPKLSVRRKVVLERYKPLLDAFYDEQLLL